MKISQLKKEVKKMNPCKALDYVEQYKDDLNIDNLKKLINSEIERLHEISKYEKALYDIGINYIAGMDEVGRGPLAGPVVACAVILPKDYMMFGIKDSKKISEPKREYLCEIIKGDAIEVSTAVVDNNIIDDINILNATKNAMKQAVNDLKTIPEQLLIDAVELKDVPINQMPMIKGDSKSISIAAASIVAKVTRDSMMCEYHKLYPEYNFISNKGYGTKEHIEAIKKHGLTPIHRKTFTKNII